VIGIRNSTSRIVVHSQVQTDAKEKTGYDDDKHERNRRQSMASYERLQRPEYANEQTRLTQQFTNHCQQPSAAIEHAAVSARGRPSQRIVISQVLSRVGPPGD